MAFLENMKGKKMIKLISQVENEETTKKVKAQARKLLYYFV